MTVYSKETALYNTDAIGSDIEGAGETATRYITSVTNDGIVVADASKGASNGSITSSTTGWHIGGVLEFIRNGVSRFWIGLKSQNDATPTVRIGKAYVANASDNESHMELDYHSMQLIDKEGDTYFHVSDLRDVNGWITDAFEGDGGTTEFPLTVVAVPPASNIVVTVNGSVVTSGILKNLTSVKFDTAPTSGAVISVKYEPSAYPTRLKAYTLGKRMANRKIGIYSCVEGYGNEASGEYSHAEGLYSAAKGHRSHAEGRSQTFGTCAHAEGYGCMAGGSCGHAEGQNTSTSEDYAHAQNLGTSALKKAQTTLGTYNDWDHSTTTIHPSGDTDYGEYAVIIGNGTSDIARSNAVTIGWDGNYIAQAMAGVIQMFAGSTAPNGWLICDGSAVSRTEYATLYAVIGTTYGTGDGSTTFNLPDLQGRTAIGAGSGANLTSRTLGATGGSESLQSHDHNVASNGYNVPGKSGGWNWRTTGSGSSDNYKNTPMGGSSASVASIAKTGSAGSGNAGNMQPFTVVNYIICTGKTS